MKIFVLRIAYGNRPSPKMWKSLTKNIQLMFSDKKLSFHLNTSSSIFIGQVQLNF